MGPIFTPPVVSKIGWAARDTLAAQAGTNWYGGSYDPETHTVYVFSQGAIGSYWVWSASESRESDME